jgi:hypothetical protein
MIANYPGGVPIRLTTRARTPIARAAAALALGAALLAGCSSDGASTDCGLDQCTVTFDRGAEGSVSVLGVDAKFIGADGDQVTVEVGWPGRKVWWRNLRDGAPVRMRLRGVERTGHARAHGDAGTGVTVRVELDPAG